MSQSVAALPPAFARLSWSNLIAQTSEQIALAASPLLAVIWLASTPSETGWLQTAQTLPFLLLSLPAGVIVDRASRRSLIVASEVVRAFALVAVLLLLATKTLTLWLLAVLGFVGAIGTVCYSVGAPALVPALVTRTQLVDANRWLELARSCAFAAGPALGGALVSWSGAATAFGLAAMLSAVAAFVLAGLPRDAPTVSRRPLLQDVGEGARFILKHPYLRPILVTALFFNFGWFVLQAIYVAYAVQVLHFSAAEVGLSLGIYGAGMIAGALLSPFIARRLSFGRAVLVGPASGFAAASLMLLTLWLPSFWIVGLRYFLFGCGPLIRTITTMTMRQAVTPGSMMGRVSAFIMTATFGARPLGAAAGALLAAKLGVSACLVVATITFLMQLIVIARSPVAALRTVPQGA